MKSIVVLSGGQDSMTCFGVAMRESNLLAGVTYSYGQKHNIEVDAAKTLCDKYGIEHIIVDLTELFSCMRSSSLINYDLDLSAKSELYPNLPSSFVPARNALFLTTAYGIAIEISAEVIYAGMCQTDYSGYPDCREVFITQLNKALDIGYERTIQIQTPLMWLTKAQTFKLAEDVDILDDVLQYSVTCYNGDIINRHNWGFGCGECPACKLREKGWEEYKQYKLGAIRNAI